MAEELEPKITAAYRELGAQEPPRALDEAILAASRNPLAGWRRPARPWTQRWAVPLSLAAVVVLSVTVTLRIQHEAPELPATAPAQPQVAAVKAAREQPEPLKLKPEIQIRSRVKAAETPAEKRAAEKPDAGRAEPRAFADAAPAREARQAPSAPAAAGPLSSATRNESARLEEARRDMMRGVEPRGSGSALGQIEDRTARDAEAAARAPQAGALFARRPESAPVAASAPQPAAKPAPAPPPPAAAPAQVARLAGETPEREFERIAQLRAEGRHDEADKAFLEFRRRYPDFRITEEMLRRVERR